jgi:hypothetical protein
MGFKQSWPLPVKIEFITIDKQDWEMCKDSDIECLRYGTWVPL